MLRLLTGAVALSLAAGCGSNVAGTISRAEAFGDCNSFSVLGWGAPLTQDVFETMLIVADSTDDPVVHSVKALLMTLSDIFDAAQSTGNYR